MNTKYDVAIVGAGIVGLATAYQIQLFNPRLKVVLIEKEDRVAAHQTGNNSGVIHSGIYYKPGSLRATNCIRGYQQLIAFCQEHEIPYELCGKIIVATTEEERSRLDPILQRGIANGMTGIKKISPAEALEIEPHVQVVEAIKVPQSGIIHYRAVSEKLAELIKANEGEIWFDTKVQGVHFESDRVVIATNSNPVSANLMINCAGLYSDKIAQMTGQKIDFQILPFRGEYYNLIPEKEYLVNHLIYPVPNPHFPFLGVHFTRMIKGGIEAGPSAVLAFQREGYSRWDFDLKEFLEILTFSGFQKLALKYWWVEIDELYRSFSKRAFVQALKHLIPEITTADVVRGGAGVRAMACSLDGELIDDYVLLEQKRVINVCNAPSPAATSSLSIGQTIAERALKHLT